MDTDVLTKKPVCISFSDTPHKQHYVHADVIKDALPMLHARLDRWSTEDRPLDLTTFPEFAPYDGTALVTGAHVAAALAWAYSPDRDPQILLACDPDLAHWEMLATYFDSTPMQQVLARTRWSHTLREVGKVAGSGASALTQWVTVRTVQVMTNVALLATAISMVMLGINRLLNISYALLQIIVYATIIYAFLHPTTLVAEGKEFLHAYYDREREALQDYINIAESTDTDVEQALTIFATTRGGFGRLAERLYDQLTPIFTIAHMVAYIVRFIAFAMLRALGMMEGFILGPLCKVAGGLQPELCEPTIGIPLLKYWAERLESSSYVV